MDSTSDTSAISSPHADLLQTAAELKVDLEKTVDRIQGLEAENSKLHGQCKYLEEQVRIFKSNYDEARNAYLKALSEKIDQESQFEGFISKVKHQLSEKSKEFEAFREKFVPQDIDFIRVKVQEEMEIRHQEKIKQIENETAYYRDQSLQIRRDYEKLTSEYDTYKELHKKELLSIYEEHNQLMKQLRQEISMLKSNDENTQLSEEIRKLKLHVTELTTYNKALQLECQQVYTEKENIQLSYDEIQSKLHVEVSKGSVHLSQVEAQCLRAEEVIRRLQQEIQQKESQIDELKRANQMMREQGSQSQYQNTQKEKDTQTAVYSAVMEYREHNEKLQLENRNLSVEMNRMQDTIYMLEERVRISQKECSELQLRAEHVESNLRKLCQQEILKIKEKSSILEIQLATKQNEIKSLNNTITKFNESILIEKEIFKNEILRLQQEKLVLCHQIKQLTSS